MKDWDYTISNLSRLAIVLVVLNIIFSGLAILKGLGYITIL